ncbi:Hypothetical protein FKW44_005434 [Caligus rogercresseyi]|uniref:Uncharacterized protein n=1 Tax=Caligus rogercresseyi TaxID=217165 RepID=A0A7T8QS18_CALRO|nr:Hypothetical protein FKW44_005434 [Caligus rogercresseyi]
MHQQPAQQVAHPQQQQQLNTSHLPPSHHVPLHIISRPRDGSHPFPARIILSRNLTISLSFSSYVMSHLLS